MRRIVEEPTSKENTDPMGGIEFSHPAYGTISASRVTGHQNLFGSEFHHNGFIAIRVKKAKFRRSLSRDWVFDGDEIVEVSLSESQWANFVSSLNCGPGTQCTINHIGRDYVAGLPDPKSQKSQFTQELLETTKRSIAALKELTEKIKDMKISEKQKSALLASVYTAERNVNGNVQFVADSFSEHMEVQTEKAKCEVNAYITGQIHGAGLAHLQAQGRLEIIVEEPKLIENK